MNVICLVIDGLQAGYLGCYGNSWLPTPGFDQLAETWNTTSPLPWDLIQDKQEIANAVVFLLGPYSRKITGQTIYVDGGASIMGGPLLPHERAGGE